LSAQTLQFELDLDGVLGDHPDTGFVDFGDTMAVDLWLSGPNQIISFVATFCHDGDVLEYIDTEYTVDDYWTSLPPVVDSCVALESTNFTMAAPPPMPVHLATIRYRAAADNQLTDILIPEAGYYSIGFQTAMFEYPTECTFLISPPIEAAFPSWGSIKRLFR